MPLFGKAPARVQPFFGFRNASRLVLSARALRSREPVFEKRSALRDIATMLGQYASREIPSFPVALELGGAAGSVQRHEARTGPEGLVHFDIALSAHTPLPTRTTWERVAVEWADDGGGRRRTDAFILAPGMSARTGIISDVDDTILETGITGNIRAIAKNWRRILAEMPGDRMIVPGAREFLATLGGEPGNSPAVQDAGGCDAPRARIRPTFYVSSSPWNLFSYLVTFKRLQDLPLGPVMLRDWGFNRRTLGSQGHGLHKREAIARIMKGCPHLRFILIGDDTQKDTFAFADMVARYPGRVAGVFIRSVEGREPPAEARAAHASIERADVPLWTGADYAEAAAFARRHGLDYASPDRSAN